MTYRSLVIVSGLLHLFVGLRLVSGLDGLPVAQLLVAAGLLFSAVLLPLGLPGHQHMRQPWADRMRWTAYILMGFFSSLLILTALRDVTLILLWLGEALLSGALPWRRINAASAGAVLSLAVAVTAIGFAIARRTAPVKRQDVTLEGLPAALHGFKLVQITDLHVGPTIKRDYVQRIVDRVNTLGADVVVVTGDVVDGSVAELGSHIAPLGSLSSRHGTFFVTGNHEYYAGAQAWIIELRRLGLTVLLNEHVILHHGPAGQTGKGIQNDEQEDSPSMAPLVLAGVTDYSAHLFDPAHQSDPRLALEGAPESVRTRVLLAHQPRSAAAAAEAGFDLQVSGHTHGGQFWPWNLFVRFQQPYTAGLNRWKNMWVYTSRGTGYWGPPNRFGSPSEITVLTLVRA